MRFPADENLPAEVVAALRAGGHDVAWVRADAPGSADREVLARASSDGRILLTFDKDSGQLAWSAGLPSSCGVVLFRLPMPPPTQVGQVIAGLLNGRDDWPGHFSVVEPGRVRMRPLR